MSDAVKTARFWYLPLKDVAPEADRADIASRDEVVADDLPADYAVPSKLFHEGIRAGHILALHDGDAVIALARVLELSGAGALHWRRLPLHTAAKPVATPELSEVEPHEQSQFTVGIDALLRDVPSAPTTVSSGVPVAPSLARPTTNILLYGPPGTGKTYSVRSRALELLGHALEPKASPDAVQASWRQRRRDGRIVFCTFHQAFAYEEFVEGLRAVTDEVGNVRYQVDPGVFKHLALTAAAEGLDDAQASGELDFDTRWSLLTSALEAEPRVVKSSTGKSYLLQTSTRDNIHAYAGDVDEEEDFFKKSGVSPLIASRSALAQAWAAREELGETPRVTELKRFNTGGTQLWLVYRELGEVTAEAPKVSVEPYERARRALQAGLPFTFNQDSPHFVLVIDEINRANIARVFGELITLLEPDKRLGTANELRVKLPSSKEWFGVPPNLHIIGTMNTADRSIALMDVALRRRFLFEEMMPDATVLRDELTSSGVSEVLRDLVVGVFEGLNQRLRFLYDREHQIGHAYYLGVRSVEDLRQVFADRILPLLQEYFFGQWGKVALVLGYPLKQEGTPKKYRGPDSAAGTILTAGHLDEKTVLGFDHDEYVDQVEWDIHPAFRPCTDQPKPRGWLVEAFLEVSGSKNPKEDAAAWLSSSSDPKAG